jgi:hypothetical protein
MAEPTTINVADIKASNPDDVRSVYANLAGIAMTTWDIRLFFSEITASAVGDAPSVIVRASVVMTPAHAKAFSKLLQTHIENYEKQFGAINAPIESGPPEK